MTLHSALEDLQETTLRAVMGCLNRLEYLSGLRVKEGSYEHWGLGRVYGELAAKKALARAHRSLLSQVLAMPIRNLVEDAKRSSEVAGLPPANYVERLSTATPNLLPYGPGAGSARHLSSVLHALSSLLKNPKGDANPPA
ncbi:MAG: hypothetical protein ABSA29_08380 [Terriglobales bacterium]|jgi:hypothetical protein